MIVRKNFFALCLTSAMVLAGCSTANKIKPEKINTSEPYRIGVVKVDGVMPIPLGEHRENKVLALHNIQYKEICKILEDEYKININTEIKDKTPKFKVDYVMNEPVTNVYFGNDTFVQKNPVAIAGLFHIYKRKKLDDMNYIDIIYRFTMNEVIPAPFTEKLYYEIEVNRNNEKIIVHKGQFATAPIPKKGPLNLLADLEKIWEPIISYAANIDESLIEDISESKIANTKMKADE